MAKHVAKFEFFHRGVRRWVNGNSALHCLMYATFRTVDSDVRRQCAKLLLDHGADVNARNGDGFSPLGLLEYYLRDDRHPLTLLLKERGGTL